jgi:hypothetical protein
MAIPKGSPYTKRFGQKFTNKMTSPIGKVPNRSFRGKYTKLADLGSVEEWIKSAVGTGDDDYESPSGSYGSHKHVQGEAECHLCKGQPIVEVERNEREVEKEAESHDSVEYHEILKIVAEAHGIDLTKPESIDLLPALLREADHVMMKHEKLETAEDELGEQMMGQNERSE